MRRSSHDPHLAHGGARQARTATLRRVARSSSIATAGSPDRSTERPEPRAVSLRKLRADRGHALPGYREPERAASAQVARGANRARGEVRVGSARSLPRSARTLLRACPIKHIKWKVVTESKSPATYVNRKGWVSGTTKNTVTHEVHMIPAWAKAIGPDKPTELRAAKKSVKLRKAALVVEAFR